MMFFLVLETSLKCQTCLLILLGEHMKPMKQWGPAPEYKTPWWNRVSPAYFAFQFSQYV